MIKEENDIQKKKELLEKLLYIWVNQYPYLPLGRLVGWDDLYYEDNERFLRVMIDRIESLKDK